MELKIRIFLRKKSSDELSFESSSSEDETDIEIQDNFYNPDGVESDDDGPSCFHWSCTQSILESQDKVR